MVPQPQRSKGLAIYNNEETKAAVQELFANQSLVEGMKAFLPPELNAHILGAKEQIQSVFDFQRLVAHPVMKAIQQSSITRLSVSGLEHLQPGKFQLFISNHRDIILDSAFLNVVLFENGFSTSQIAIGDNLMRHRLSELIFHINKSFVVKRTGTPMELYRYSLEMSEYIKEQIIQGIDSVWIAQREGRAKDGNDRTQTGLLKMLSLSSGGNLKAHFQSLNVTPVSISYEYDPCDLLKAQEYLFKMENPNYKKTFQEDVQHMLLGLKGSKGAVHFHFGAPLQTELDAFDAHPAAKKQLELLAEMIDRSIHQNYQLCPINYVAHDLLSPAPRYGDRYSPSEFEQIKAYFDEKSARLQGDMAAGREYLLKMYANPVINHHNTPE